MAEYKRRWALEGTRVIDLTWLLAGPGGTRILASLGAEVIRVECREPRAVDFLRYTPPFPRKDSGAPAQDYGMLSGSPANGLNRSGNFNNINPGKFGVTLNLNHPKGRDLLRRLVAKSHVLCENFSPERMDQWGVGYGDMRRVNPSVIYVQTTGMGKAGVYRDYAGYGPTAQALSGMTAMSGLPEPRQPAGWGYSYLDHSPGYYSSMMIIAALIRQRRTGQGCYIDLSQTEIGIMLSGAATLKHQFDGQPTRRHGNRMPYAPWIPHGAFPCRGDDEWIAIAVQNDEQWAALAAEIGSWALDDRFARASARKANEDDLEHKLAAWTADHDSYGLTARLQALGVPVGPVQKSADRFTRDPQLEARKYFVTLPHSEIGDWPFDGFPARMSASPAYVGGLANRGAPVLGEDNEHIYREILGIGAVELRALQEEGAV
jgi:crotonobetainyl-CoA:carnitine CoA-transferase CaiB-like acyl-CoA transferase